MVALYMSRTGGGGEREATSKTMLCLETGVLDVGKGGARRVDNAFEEVPQRRAAGEEGTSLPLSTKSLNQRCMKLHSCWRSRRMKGSGQFGTKPVAALLRFGLRQAVDERRRKDAGFYLCMKEKLPPQP
mmetsp:Transcript_40611/g.128080  ORF Transcript_40611/g.128080 Transcript_40611/m.128080 type:complete len:129 (+) Transcript_40611:1422-1808(+)